MPPQSVCVVPLETARMLAKTLATFSVLAASLMLGACAGTMESLEQSLNSPLTGPKDSATKTADAGAATSERSELEKATEYWGKKNKEKPTDLEPALNYARNLRAMGERQQAMAVIQQSAVYHSDDRQLASEYGRIALELDQLSIAKQMLSMADDPSAPDWKVISARGTLAAKEGKYRDAIGLFERANSLSNDHPSVLNNLALAYAMNGEAAKAEDMLRRLDGKGGSARTRQNLALVLNLQGKFDEAKQIAAKDIGPEGASQNAEFMRRMVKVDTAADWATSTKAGGSPRPPVTKAVAAASDTIGTAAAFSTEILPGDTAPVPLAPAKPLPPASANTLRGLTP